EQATAALRESEARAAAEILGIESVEFFRLPDGGLQAGQPASDRLHGALVDWRPDSIYLPHAREMHADHRAAVRLLKRSLPGICDYAPRILMYEIWTPLQQIDEIVDI